MELSNFIASDSLTVSEVMQSIDKNANGIVFLINANSILTACVTDGDIRRYLIGGGKMSDLALRAANRTPKVARSFEEAKNLYHEKNWIAIPVVDDKKNIVDIYFGGRSDTLEKARTALNIPVVINAGGKGTRLEPYTKVLPKPLIPVGEHPIIELIMREYQSYSCNDFHIIVNYKKDLMKAYFHDSEDQFNITWYDEESPLGTGGGLSLLRGKLKSTFFFANCDALLTANYASMVKFHKEQGNVITMVCVHKSISIPYGVVEIGEGGLIEKMEEKPTMSFLANAGIYIVEPEVIDDIEDCVAVGFPEVVELERRKGRKVAVFPVGDNDWMDMGQVTELEKMRLKLYGE